jgi:hypothetical protein
MKMMTWTQYVSMDDPFVEPAGVEAELDRLGDLDEDFELGEPWSGEPFNEEE